MAIAAAQWSMSAGRCGRRAIARAGAWTLSAMLRAWGRASGVSVMILRVPGIYAADRLPLERIRAGTPALAQPEDAYTNHIHADDLARIVLAALARGRAGRAYNAADGSWLKMGDYFDLVAERFGLPLPPRDFAGRSGATRPAGPAFVHAGVAPPVQSAAARGTSCATALSDSSGMGSRKRLRLLQPSSMSHSLSAEPGRIWHHPPPEIGVRAMESVMLVLTNLPDREAARKLAEGLVGERDWPLA